MIKIRAILGRRLPLLIIATLLGAAAGVASAALAPPEAKPSYVVEQLVVANPTGQGSNIQQDALRVTRGAVVQRAAETLGEPDSADQLAGRIQSTAQTDTSAISISTSSEDIPSAKALVKAFTDAFLVLTNADLQKDQNQALDRARANVDDLAQQLVDFDAANPGASSIEATLSLDPVTRALAEQRAQLVQSQQSAKQDAQQQEVAITSQVPYSALGTPTVTNATTNLLDVPKSPTLRAGLLGFVGLLLGAGLVLVIERAKPRIDTREELAEATNLPIIAEIGYLPKGKRSAHGDGRLRLDGVWGEPYRRVRAAVQFVQQPNASTHNGDSPWEPPQVFLITSAQPGEGKSTSAALTGLALAEVHVPTVIVGADFRKPTVDQLVGSTPGPTIQDLAEMAAQLPTADDVVRITEHSDLYLASGGPSTREVSQRLSATKELIRECRRRGATVVIDSCPLQAANDTIDLLEVIDEVILVVRSGEETTAALVEAIELLRQHGAHLMGVLLLGAPGVGRRQTYYEDYYIQSDRNPSRFAT